MKLKKILIILVCISIVVNLIAVFRDVYLSIFGILLSLLIIWYTTKKGEKYDYDKENPNALIRGKNVSGTVYAAYPEISGGLGWIL